MQWSCWLQVEALQLRVFKAEEWSQAEAEHNRQTVGHQTVALPRVNSDVH